MHALALLASLTWLAEQPWSLQGDLGVTLLQRPATATSRWRLASSNSLGANFGRHWGSFDLFARAEADHWSEAREDGSRDHVLALNLGPGAGFTYAGGLVRSSVAAGLSVLVVPTDIDKAGSLGVFVDLRPISLRWPLRERTWIGICPLSLTLTAPVLTGIPLVQVEYRTSVQAERSF